MTSDGQKNKIPTKNDEDYRVVAGTGLFYDPERGGLNTEALRSRSELWAFLFYSIAYKQA